MLTQRIMNIKIFIGDELEQFRGDKRFGEAFIFDGLPKDEIGIGAYKDGRLLGMAGATSDSDRMWQIGINVMPEAEGLGIGTMLVAAIKNEILDKIDCLFMVQQCLTSRHKELPWEQDLFLHGQNCIAKLSNVKCEVHRCK